MDGILAFSLVWLVILTMAVIYVAFTYNKHPRHNGMNEWFE